MQKDYLSVLCHWRLGFLDSCLESSNSSLSMEDRIYMNGFREGFPVKSPRCILANWTKGIAAYSVVLRTAAAQTEVKQWALYSVLRVLLGAALKPDVCTQETRV